MYRVLIATNEPSILDRLNESMDWESMNFRPPMVVGTANAAIETMETKRVDCIAYMLESREARRLSTFLNTMRPSLPIFELHRSVDAQKRIVGDMRRLLDRLHNDTTDDMDQDTALALIRDEFTHNLLAEEIESEAALRGQLQMMRFHFSTDKKCVMYEFDLPQGEVYMNARWHYGSERLENALRSNFFGRYYEDLYYIIAVLTPRHIRLVVCQRDDRENEPEESLVERADQHVKQTVDSIAEYLCLDMVLTSRQVLPNLCALAKQH